MHGPRHMAEHLDVVVVVVVVFVVAFVEGGGQGVKCWGRGRDVRASDVKTLYGACTVSSVKLPTHAPASSFALLACSSRNQRSPGRLGLRLCCKSGAGRQGEGEQGSRVGCPGGGQTTGA